MAVYLGAYRVTCPSCRRVVYYEQWEGKPDVTRSLNCPCCGAGLGVTGTIDSVAVLVGENIACVTPERQREHGGTICGPGTCPPSPTIYTCFYCGATFSSQGALNSHIASAHPPTIYTCPHCGASFSSQVELDAHIASAHPPTIYTCPHCGATFSSQAELDAHIASAHPPTIYTCPHCGASFGSQAELDAHIASEHPGFPPAAEVPWYKRYAPYLITIIGGGIGAVVVYFSLRKRG